MSTAASKSMADKAATYGLSAAEYAVILERLGREPNDVELGVFSVMWSEHCSYKSSKIHLSKFPTTGPRVICGPGENAGVIDIDDGQACIFKMESHNHPSFIEPYQGAATGVGGIMRDVFTMGAAGLTSSSVEMAGKGGVGIELDLDAVPQREDGMSAYEMMLSESQERMLAILKPGREADGQRIFAKWGLDAATIGVTTQTGRLVLKHHGAVVADVPLAPLFDDAPLYERPWTDPKPQPRLDPSAIPAPEDWGAAVLKLMSAPDMASKRWLWEQYDRHVMADTLEDSATGADAGIVRVHGTRKALAVTSDVTPRYVQADPYEGGKQAVAEAWRNLTAVGAEPIAITDNLNFGNPERPEIMGQIVRAIEGMAEACRALDFPVVSGNVSLYNETNGAAIPPTPTVGAVGLIADYGRRADFSSMKAGDLLILIGDSGAELGASMYLREILGREDGAPPPVDLVEERKNGDFVRALIQEGLVRTVHDISDGGLIAAAAEMALASDVGLTLKDQYWDVAELFGEDQARYLIAIPPTEYARIFERAAAADVDMHSVGDAGGDSLVVILDSGADRFIIPLDTLRTAHEGWMSGYMNG